MNVFICVYVRVCVCARICVYVHMRLREQNEQFYLFTRLTSAYVLLLTIINVDIDENDGRNGEGNRRETNSVKCHFLSFFAFLRRRLVISMLGVTFRLS